MIFEPLFTLIVAANFAVAVRARNETIIHGWVPEPQGRGTWSILWGCLVTISLCTWSAVHMSVPRTGEYYLPLRKFRYTLIAIVAPELPLAMAADSIVSVRNVKKKLHSVGKTEWTFTHLHFSFDGGFIHKFEGADSQAIDPSAVYRYIILGKVAIPPVTQEELCARGEANTAVRFFAVVQIIWFVAQLIARGSQKYQIIGLEIFTACFVFCSVLTYALNLKRPQNVEYPVTLDIHEGMYYRWPSSTLAMKIVRLL